LEKKATGRATGRISPYRRSAFQKELVYKSNTLTLATPIFPELLRLYDGDMERFPSPYLPPKFIINAVKMAFKLNKKKRNKSAVS